MPELRTHLFTIGVAGQTRTTLLLCSGRMGPGSAEVVRGALAAAIGTPAPVVEVDLRKVSVFDDGATAAFVQAHQELTGEGRDLRLVVNARTHAHLRRLGMDGILNLRRAGDVDLARLPGVEEEREPPGRAGGDRQREEE